MPKFSESEYNALLQRSRSNQRKKPEYIEKGLQTRCEYYLKLNNISYIHLTTFLPVKCHKCNKWINKGIPGNKGLPDLVIFLDQGRTVFVELKSASGRLKDHQKEFKDTIEGLGHLYHIFRDFESFKKALDSYQNS